MTQQGDPNFLHQHVIENAVRIALHEDLGLKGDVTTNATVSRTATAIADIVAREAGIIAGIDVAKAAFLELDRDLAFKANVNDSAAVASGDIVCSISGSASALLSAERVALNFLGHLSGIASLTRKYVDAVSHTNATIIDTRKTTPGLRALEKYAVTCGGGSNHRSGLFDAILIKDNHVVAAGGLESAISRARSAAVHVLKIEVEVDTLEQLQEVLRHKVDAVLLDNMPPEKLKEAVALAAGKVATEASGGVNLETVAAIAASGVDFISIGALTHSAPVFDVGLDFRPNTS